MVKVVVVINTLSALMLLYAAWRVRQLRWRLARIADRLTKAERIIYALLHVAPDAISKGQQGIHQLRQKNLPLDLKIQRVRQVLTLLGIGQQFWQRSLLSGRSKFFARRL